MSEVTDMFKQIRELLDELEGGWLPIDRKDPDLALDLSALDGLSVCVWDMGNEEHDDILRRPFAEIANQYLEDLNIEDKHDEKETVQSIKQLERVTRMFKEALREYRRSK